MTTVSVIVPAFNQARWLPETLKSALEQTVPPTEVIVVDDGSPDNSAEIAARFGGVVRVIRKKNEGLSAARNTGILNCSGDWLIFLDSDDLLPPRFIEQHLLTVQETECDVAFAGHVPIDEHGNRIGCEKFGGMLNGESPLEALLRGNAFPPHAAMTRRQCLANAGMFDPWLTSYEDWDFWLRLAYAGAKFATTPDLIVPYRQYPGSMSKNATRMFQTGMTVLKKIEVRSGLTFRARRSLVNARWGLRKNYVEQYLRVLGNKSAHAQERPWSTFMRVLATDPFLLMAHPRHYLRASFNRLKAQKVL